MERLNVATHPELATMKLPIQQLRWSHHALDRAEEKDVSICSVVPKEHRVVELEVKADKVKKAVIRYNPDGGDYDTVLVLVPYSGEWKVVTTWKNHWADNHGTLNLRRLSK